MSLSVSSELYLTVGGNYKTAGGAGFGIDRDKINGAFGAGGTGWVDGVTDAGPHGGGGWYGGGAVTYCGGTGGGSGYIGNPLLTNKHMYGYGVATSDEENTKTISGTCASETPKSDCAKIGDGYARITYLGR